MKVKELIKMLSEVDQECHVRIIADSEGQNIPFAVNQKPGYWDGPYSYFSEDKDFVISVKNSKVDITCMSLETFIYDKAGKTDKIKLEAFDSYLRKEEHEKYYLDEINRISEEYKTHFGENE